MFNRPICYLFSSSRESPFLQGGYFSSPTQKSCLHVLVFLFLWAFSGVKNSNPKEKFTRSSSSASLLVAMFSLFFLLKFSRVFECKMPKNSHSRRKLFLKTFVCWRHQRAQWEYEARSHNWIWLHELTSYVIIESEINGELEKSTYLAICK